MNPLDTQRIVALVLLFVLFIAKRTKPRSSSAANLGFGLASLLLRGTIGWLLLLEYPIYITPI